MDRVYVRHARCIVTTFPWCGKVTEGKALIVNFDDKAAMVEELSPCAKPGDEPSEARALLIIV